MTKEFPAESEGLGPLRVSDLIIGRVAGVNDASAELVQEFKPTRYELRVLARHYLKKLTEIDYMWIAFGQSGSYEIRFDPFAERRLGTICSILGEEEFREAIAPVEAEWKKWQEENLKCKQCGKPRSIPLIQSDVLCDRCGSGKVNDEADTDSLHIQDRCRRA